CMQQWPSMLLLRRLLRRIVSDNQVERLSPCAHVAARASSECSPSVRYWPLCSARNDADVQRVEDLDRSQLQIGVMAAYGRLKPVECARPIAPRRVNRCASRATVLIALYHPHAHSVSFVRAHARVSSKRIRTATIQGGSRDET